MSQLEGGINRQSDTTDLEIIKQKRNELLEQEPGSTGTKLTDVLKDDYHEFVTSLKKITNIHYTSHNT